MASFASVSTTHSPSRFSATRRSPRSSASMIASTSTLESLLQDFRRAPAVVQAGAEAEPRERLRAFTAGHLDPEIHRGGAARYTHAAPGERGLQQLALAPVPRARLLDV